jgi:CPA2 family monovalent cation:H+ antiporter-2
MPCSFRPTDTTRRAPRPPLITTIAAAFAAAWVLGILTQKIGLSPIVGYLLAGVAIGPHTPGFVGDVKLAQQLAELGVILLMFGVGLHFHLKDLLAVRNVAVPGAIGQSLVTTILAVLVSWPLKSSPAQIRPRRRHRHVRR